MRTTQNKKKVSYKRLIKWEACKRKKNGALLTAIVPNTFDCVQKKNRQLLRKFIKKNAHSLFFC